MCLGSIFLQRAKKKASFCSARGVWFFAACKIFAAKLPVPQQRGEIAGLAEYQEIKSSGIARNLKGLIAVSGRYISNVNEGVVPPYAQGVLGAINESFSILGEHDFPRTRPVAWRAKIILSRDHVSGFEFPTSSLGSLRREVG